MSTEQHTRTLLMIDDDPGHIHLVKKNLRRTGLAFEFEMFTSGADALDRIFDPTDLPAGPMAILLDLNMPGLNGQEILSRLKTNDQTKHIPVIVLTTTDNPREVEQCYALGANLYMVKPVGYEQFATSIEKLAALLNFFEFPRVSN